jgi:hypothetical protein
VDDEFISLPGARDFTVAEYVGGRIRRTRMYGEWVELSAEVAGSVEPLRTWCLRLCNSQLPAGGFRFAPATWQSRATDPLPVPFVPEFDHPDPVLRALAATERQRRILVASLEAIDLRRRDQARVATQHGYSRRRLGALLGLSFSRIQQLISE